MIFLDFDEVVFDTKAFAIDLNEIYFNNGILREDLGEYRKTISNHSKGSGLPYKPERVVEFTKKNNKEAQRNIISKVEIFLKNLEKYVFSDALFFFKKNPKSNLSLLSYGDFKFQQDKILGSKVDKYFFEIIIDTQDKIDLILKITEKNKLDKKEKIFFIDDKLENLEKIEAMDKEIITIWLNRYDAEKVDSSIKADYQVKNLKEALKFIQ